MKRSVLFIAVCFCCLSVVSCADKEVFPVWEYEGGGSPGEEPGEEETPGPLASVAAIRNPERGWLLESNYFVHDLQNPFNPGVYFPELWIPYVETVNNTQADSLSLTQLTFYLTGFIGKDISQTGLDNMQRVFDSVKEKGYKVHLSFAYDYDQATGAAFTDVFRHLDQLTPLIRKNLGLIDFWKMSFIGTWGEGNGSPMSDDWPNKTLLVKAILDAFPDRFMGLRYPSHLARFVELGLSDEYVRRVGFENDYFTASEHPLAPGNDYTFDSADYRLVQEKSPYVKVAGEIPYDEDTQWGLHELISVPNSIRALKEHHYSAFDVTQNNSLNLAHWKRYELTPEMLKNSRVLFDESYFRTPEGKLVARSAYQFVRDHLGYRLYVDTAATRLQASGGCLDYRITVYNTGFSAIRNPRPVKLVFVDEAGRLASTVDLDGVDPRNWQPHDPATGDFKQLYHTFTGQVSPGVSGTFQVGLWLPDPTEPLRELADYSVVFANTEVIRTPEYRVNIIGEVDL